MVTTDRYDFKGNLLHSYRQFAKDYKNVPGLVAGTRARSRDALSISTTYDALNRVVTMTSPDRSVYRPTYNEANLLEKIDVVLRGAQRDGHPVWTPFVPTSTTTPEGSASASTTPIAPPPPTYDEKTFRLIQSAHQALAGRDDWATRIFADATRSRIFTTPTIPSGNITQIADDALRTVFHDNHKVDPVCRYTYDPLYRLIEATGRENIGQSAFRLQAAHGDYRDYPFVGAAQLCDLQALRNYTERYEYDPVGNFLRMIHRAKNGNWTRHYTYDEDSLIEPGREEQSPEPDASAVRAITPWPSLISTTRTATLRRCRICQ